MGRRQVLAALVVIVVCSITGVASSAQVSDRDLQVNVEQKLRGAPLIGQRVISIEVRDGVVTLYGGVETLYEEWSAVDHAGDVRGVRSVESRLDIIYKSAQSDDSIAMTIQRRFSMVPALESENIEVAVEGGKVRLGGFVKQAQDRTTAVDEAAMIRGVTAVEMAIDTPAQEDAEIATAAKYLLNPKRSSAGVRGSFDVAVKDGVVTLTGRVARPYYRKQAERAILAVNGVRRVENQLEVRPGS